MSQDKPFRQNDKTTGAPHPKKPVRKAEKIPKKITASYLHNAGLYYLERFSASTAHFRTVMRRKIRKSCTAHPDQDETTCHALLETLIETFVRAGLLNDPLYAKAQITSLRRSGKSARAIQVKMLVKGVPAPMTTETLGQLDTETHTDPQEAEFQAALRHAQKKRLGPFRTRGEPEPQKDLSRMARAGFSFDTARRVLHYTDDDF